MKKRLFIALDILETDKVKIAQWRDQNLSLQFNAICTQNFHITLAFIGFIDQQRQEQLIALINEQHEVIQQHVAQQSL